MTRHKKDLYFVTEPSMTPWLCEIAGRGVWIPGDIYYRVFSLAAGPDYGRCICLEPKAPYFLSTKGELAE